MRNGTKTNYPPLTKRDEGKTPMVLASSVIVIFLCFLNSVILLPILIIPLASLNVT